MKNYLITLIDKEGNQKKIGCQSENVSTAVGYATSQMQMPFTVVSVEELSVDSDDRLTPLERIILENTNKKYKYIARDECGELFVYKDKPYKEDEYWELPEDEKGYHFYERTADLHVYEHLFQNIKWEDEEPYKFR